MKWYCCLLCHHPYAVVFCISSLVTVCLVLSLTSKQLPAFNDPALGFEARGTEVSNRAAAWHAMLEATRPSGPLTVNPAQEFKQKQLGQHEQHRQAGSTRRGKHRVKGGGQHNKTRHKFKHTHMVCVEAVGGDLSVQLNCTSEDLQKLHQLHLNTDNDETNNIAYSDDDDEKLAFYSNVTSNNSSRSVAAAGMGVGEETTQRSPLEKLRLLGLKHDHHHINDNKDYLINREPLHHYDHYDYVEEEYDNEENYDEEYSNSHHDHQHTAEDGFFCNPLVPDYGHVVVSVVRDECPPTPHPGGGLAAVLGFAPTIPANTSSFHLSFSTGDGVGSNETEDVTATSAASLLTLQHLKELCALDQRLREVPAFDVICQRSSPDSCCPSWSIPNYAALLANKTDCSLITEEDVLYLRGLLHTCGHHFDLSLQGGCGGAGRCSRLPPACMLHDAVYTILHYLADVDFMAQHQFSGHPLPWSSLRTSVLFLPVARSSSTLPFYEQLTRVSLREGDVAVLAMELGVKNALFDKLLVQDAVLVVAAGVAVLVLVLAYTASLLVTIVTIATVASSLLIAYFVYTFVFRIAFFPYMNVLTCIIAVALGADDTFVFCRVWRSVSDDSGACAVAATGGKGGCGGGRKVAVKFMQSVMSHASSSVVVTSLTTAAAFLASTTSPITAIKCFSLFAGSVVMANLLLMLTWVPATLVIAERWGCCRLPWADASLEIDARHPGACAIVETVTGVTSHHHNPAFITRTVTATTSSSSNNHSAAATPSLPSNSSPSIIPLDNTHAALATTHISPPASPPPHSPALHSPRSISSHSASQSPPRSPHIPIHIPSSSIKPAEVNCCWKAKRKLPGFLTNFSTMFFEKFLPWAVVKPRFLWVVMLFGIAMYAGVLVLYYPKLRLPDSSDFQLFNRDHYFERYDLDHKYNFWFERNLRSDVVNRLPVRIVWGFKPIDNGDHLNPASESTLEFDSTFDLSAPESQSWLLQFCRDLRKQQFYLSTLGPLLPNCFIETFKAWMEERRCADISQNRYPCCEMMRFPYPRWVFDKCIMDAVNVLYQTPRLYFVPGVAGPKFNKSSGKVAALVVEYDSTAIWSLSFDHMHRFFTQVEEWSSKQLADAPPGLKGGWFTSYLEFFEVQRSLLEGTKVAVLVAVAVSLVVLLLTTFNVVVSIIAVISVASVMMVTLALLVILGWRLNVLESIVMTAAIGLAVDLTLHYAVAYTKAPQGKRSTAVAWAVTRLGSPVLMATLTSLAAAFAMLPATVLAYIHVATFLIIISLTSFVYSTFFFLPLMSIVGPEDNCGLIVIPTNCSKFCICREDEQSGSKSGVYQQACVSESTLSTSSVCPSAPFSSGGGNAAVHDYDTHYLHCHNSAHELEPLTSPTFGPNVGFTLKYDSAAAITHNISGGASGGGDKLNSKNDRSSKYLSKLQQKHHRFNANQQCNSSTHHQNNVQQQPMGLLVSIQQSRRHSRQLHHQQNGSCAQLVIRKESTESQVSCSGEVECVCRSASVSSRPSTSSRRRGNADKDRGSFSSSSSTKQQPSHNFSSGKARGAKKQIVSKQDSSPHLTPANSVSTLVCSEPDTELEATALAEQLRAQLEDRVGCEQRLQQHHQCRQQTARPSISAEQQQRQLQFVKQHAQQYCTTDCDAAASMV